MICYLLNLNCKLNRIKNYFTSIFIFFLLFIPLFSSCGILVIKNKVINIKYREKNPIDVLIIESSCGNIEIIGWSKDSIEINVKKVLNNGFITDLQLLNTAFEEKDKILTIKTKIPASIDGKIDFKIYLPYILKKISASANSGSISISKYLGDLELENNKGILNVNFSGSILRIKSMKSKINININSPNSSDIIVNNKEENTKINISSIGKQSYLDVNSIDGNIDVNIANDIDHKLFIINNKKININYAINKKIINTNYNYSIFGTCGENFNNFVLNVFNENGDVNFYTQKNKVKPYVLSILNK